MRSPDWWCTVVSSAHDPSQSDQLVPTRTNCKFHKSLLSRSDHCRMKLLYQVGSRGQFFHNLDYRTFGCRRPIKMSLLCQLQMTLPRGYAGGVWGDGSAHERWGAAAARGAAGFESRKIDRRSGGAAARARTPLG